MTEHCGWYKERNKTYHVATCRHCGANVTMTEKQRDTLADNINKTILGFLDDNIKCCVTPEFGFEWFENGV